MNSRLLAIRVSRDFDGGVAYAESLLHLLDRSMRPNEGSDKDLIFHAQAGQLRKLEVALDNDVLPD